MMPKPHAPIKERLPKRKQMTIAIGVLCTEGIVVAADTKITATDGTTSIGPKVLTSVTEDGNFVIANASNDGNAANTLIPDLFEAIQQQKPLSLIQLEKIVRGEMAHWAAQFPQGAPSIQMILGAEIKHAEHPNQRFGGGMGLYFCEPPNTMVWRDYFDDSKGYVAIGTGSAITDPIFRTLFSNTGTAKSRLMEISYLMYRAKQDAGSFCGGHTNAVILKREATYPLWVNYQSMIAAEKLGPLFDQVLMFAAATVIPQNDGSYGTFSSPEDVALAVKHLAEEYNQLTFSTLQSGAI